MEGVPWLGGGRNARGCGEVWEVWERFSGGDRGQIMAGRAAMVAPNEGDAGMWAAGEGSVRPEMSVTPIFGWMKAPPNRLAPSPNILS